MVGKPDLLDTAMPMSLSSRLSSRDKRCSKMASFAYRSLLAGRPSLLGTQLICSSSALRRASAFLQESFLFMSVLAPSVFETVKRHVNVQLGAQNETP